MLLDLDRQYSSILKKDFSPLISSGVAKRPKSFLRCQISSNSGWASKRAAVSAVRIYPGDIDYHLSIKSIVPLRILTLTLIPLPDHSIARFFAN